MATLNARSLSEIVETLRQRLAAVLWNGSPAFSEVKAFAAADLPEAFRMLALGRDRVCLIAATEVTWEPDVAHALQVWRRVIRLSLLCADTRAADQTGGFLGGASGPGAWRLAELAVESACGELLPAPNPVFIRPSAQTALTLAEIARQVPGRAVVSVDVEAVGGTLKFSLNQPVM